MDLSQSKRGQEGGYGSDKSESFTEEYILLNWEIRSEVGDSSDPEFDVPNLNDDGNSSDSEDCYHSNHDMMIGPMDLRLRLSISSDDPEFDGKEEDDPDVDEKDGDPDVKEDEINDDPVVKEGHVVFSSGPGLIKSELARETDELVLQEEKLTVMDEKDLMEIKLDLQNALATMEETQSADSSHEPVKDDPFINLEQPFFPLDDSDESHPEINIWAGKMGESLPNLNSPEELNNFFREFIGKDDKIDSHPGVENEHVNFSSDPGLIKSEPAIEVDELELKEEVLGVMDEKDLMEIRMELQNALASMDIDNLEDAQSELSSVSADSSHERGKDETSFNLEQPFSPLTESDPELDTWVDKMGESLPELNIPEESNKIVPEIDDLAGQVPSCRRESRGRRGKRGRRRKREEEGLFSGPNHPFKPHEKERTIMVQNLPVDTTTQQLKDFFIREFGCIQEVYLRTHERYRIFTRISVQNDPSIIAFIIFKKEESQKTAINRKSVAFRNHQIILSSPDYPKSRKFSLHLSNLSEDTTEQDLMQVFEHYGNILSTEIANNGVGYVTFEHCSSPKKAAQFKNILIKGRLISVQKWKDLLTKQPTKLKKKAKIKARQANPIDASLIPINADAPPPINVANDPANPPKTLALRKRNCTEVKSAISKRQKK